MLLDYLLLISYLILSCLGIWMSSNAMMQVVDRIMEEALPPLNSIGLPGVLEAYVEERKRKVQEDGYVFRHIWDGVAYIERLLKTRHIWLSQWKLAVKLGKRIRFLTLSMFVDDFVKQMNSKVKLTVFQSTLGNVLILYYSNYYYILGGLNKITVFSFSLFFIKNMLTLIKWKLKKEVLSLRS